MSDGDSMPGKGQLSEHPMKMRAGQAVVIFRKSAKGNTSALLPALLYVGKKFMTM